MKYLAIGFFAFIGLMAVSIGLDFLYAWLFSVAINHTFQQHYPALKFFWLMLVTGSYLSFNMAFVIGNTVKR